MFLARSLIRRLSRRHTQRQAVQHLDKVLRERGL